MTEDNIIELIKYIQEKSGDSYAIHSKFEQCVQAIKWANKFKRWDLVIELTDALSSTIARESKPRLAKQDTKHPLNFEKEFWEQGRFFAKEGLLAVEKEKTQKRSASFLGDLARLSGYLDDFEMALYYIEKKLHLISSDKKWRVALELGHLGNRANTMKDFLAARACYQKCILLHQELNNKDAVGEMLSYLVANETERIEQTSNPKDKDADELRSILDILWKLGAKFRQEATQNQPADIARKTSPFSGKINQTEVDPTYRLLQETLFKLNSFT